MSLISEQAQVSALFERLTSAPLIAFPRWPRELDVPESPGVYILYCSDGAVKHVGRSTRGVRGLRQRLGNHHSGASSFVKKYLYGDKNPIRNGYRFRYLELWDARQRALLEAYAVGCLCPAHLGLGESLAEA